MTQRFAGRRVLITGAAGGLGRAFATAFAAQGAALVLTDLDAAGLDEAAIALRAQGAPCATHALDLAQEPAVLAFGAQFAGQKLDVLVNNAGLAYGEIAHGFEKLGQEKWLRYLAVNAVAPLILAQALRVPLAAAKGVILNISSMASYVPGTAYGVTKAALNAMTYGMAGSFGAEGIRVNAIAPGIMQTPASVGSLPPETYARVQGQQTLKTHGLAEDIANLAVFLASDEARFVHGEIVSCDGGNRLRGWRG
jgi:3-oxoacyl-[acyl-carrier protein] reductase